MSQKYLNYNSSGEILGFYADDIHGVVVKGKDIYNTEKLLITPAKIAEVGTVIVGKNEDGSDKYNTEPVEITPAEYAEAGTVIVGKEPDTVDLSAIPKTNIKITDEEWQDCLNHPGRCKVDLTTLKIVECEPVITKEQQITALDAEYQPQFTALAQSLGLATLDGNQTVIDSIKSDYATLKAEYTKKREAIS